MSFLNELKLSLESQSESLKENEYSNLSMETLCNDIRYLAYSDPNIEYFGISTEGVKEFAKKTVEVVKKMLKWIKEKVSKLISMVLGMFNSKERKNKQEEIKKNHTNKSFKRMLPELDKLLPEIDKHEEVDKKLFKNLEDYGKDIPYDKMLSFLNNLTDHFNLYLDYTESVLDYHKYKDFDDLKDHVNGINAEATVNKSMIEKSNESGIALSVVFISKLLNIITKNGVKFNPKSNITDVSEKTHNFMGGNVYYGANNSTWPEYSKYKGKETINDDFLKTVDFYQSASIIVTSNGTSYTHFLNDLKGYEKWYKNKIKVYEEKIKVLENEPEDPYTDFRAMVISDIVTKCEKMLITIARITSDFVNYDKHLINYVSSVDLIIAKLAKSTVDKSMGYNE